MRPMVPLHPRSRRIMNRSATPQPTSAYAPIVFRFEAEVWLYAGEEVRRAEGFAAGDRIDVSFELLDG